MNRRAYIGKESVNRTSFTLKYNQAEYAVQADVSCSWTKYFAQTHTSPEEPVQLDECELHELVEVLDSDGNDVPIGEMTVGLMVAISEACTDRDLVEPGLVPNEEGLDYADRD